MTPPLLISLPLAESAYMLVSVWKPILLLIPLIAWAWMISTIFDKHASRFFLGAEKWGVIHMVFGGAALAAGFLMPLPGILGFLVGFFAMIAILAIDIGVFVAVTNKDERVPERAHLKLDFSSMQEARAAKAEQKMIATVSLDITTPSKTKVAPPKKETPEYELRGIAEQVYIKASQMGASRVDILPLPQKNAYGVSFVVDGVRQPGEQMTQQQGVQVIDFWKSTAELDTEDRRRRQVGTCTISTELETITLRLETIGSQAGPKLTMIVEPEKAVTRKTTELGLLDKQFEAVEQLAAEGKGVVLLACPAENGRTTMLYSITGFHDPYTSNVQTLELEARAPLEGIRQNIFDTTAEEGEFSTTARSIFRRDPDVVAIAELPDSDTALQISKADLDRTRAYVSVKADSALMAIQLWAKAVGDAPAAAKALHGVIAHRLIRKLCHNCRVPYAPPADMLAKLGLPADKVKQLHKKGGQVLIRNKPEVCPVCQGVGYKGQTGVFEVVIIGDEERAMIEQGNLNGLKQAMAKRGTLMIQQAALRKAVEGVTSVEEIMRVLSPSKPKQRPTGGGDKPKPSTPEPTTGNA